MDSSLKIAIENNLKTLVNTVTSHYDIQIEELKVSLEEHSLKIEELEMALKSSRETIDYINTEYSRLNNEYSNLKEEFENYQKVSIVKNLNQQISERDNEIYFLKKQLDNQPTDLDPDPEPEPEDPYDAETDHEEGNVVEDESVEDDNDHEEGTVVEDESVEDDNDHEEGTVVEDDESVEEIELSFLEMKIKPPNGKRRKAYYVTDDENMEIYEKLVGGEVGEEPIGQLVGKDKTPHFY
jgi:hypothetical protein